METFQDIRPGDRVTCHVHGGLNIDGTTDRITCSGKCVMAFEHHVVINKGGRFGIPQVVDSGNYISHRSK